MTDTQLVQEYAQSRTPGALAELAARHVDWVYSAALRMVGDVDIAQDVTQAAFLVLVQKAATLGSKPVNAWLFGVTRYAAKHALRDRARRHRHERIAAQMFGETKTTDATDDAWKEISPLLDELVGRLGPRERQAILLRFYERKSMAQVGGALGVSEDAAKKRVGKSVRRLRELMAARGISTTAPVLGAVMLVHTTCGAPKALASLAVTTSMGAASITTGVIAMMALKRLRAAVLVVVAAGLIPAALSMALQSGENPPATQPRAMMVDQQDDALALYLRASAAITVDAPSSTAMIRSEYPPDSPDWRRVAAGAWNAGGRTRQLAHQARSIARINWAVDDRLKALNSLRNLANNLADAAVYAHMQGNDAQAIDIIQDLNHMSDLLMNSPGRGVVGMLVGHGMQGLAADRLLDIASDVALTNDPRNTRDLQVETARQVIAHSLDLPDPRRAIDATLAAEEPALAAQMTDAKVARAFRTFKLCDMGQAMAGMSLACHIFKFEKGRWPNSLGELIPAYLPEATIDPWGDGKQTFGYVLVKGGLPGGSNRPLVFSRADSSDGLFYLVNKFFYGYYVDDGLGQPQRLQKHGGEFYDVARWEPIANYTGPATRPAPAEAMRTPESGPGGRGAE